MFGTGGIASSTFGQAPPKPPIAESTTVIKAAPAPSERVTAMTVDPQDRPVLVGESASKIITCGDLPSAPQYGDRSFIGRFTATGQVDTSFVTNGALGDEAALPATAVATGPDAEIAAAFAPDNCSRGGSPYWAGTEVLSAAGATQARMEGTTGRVAIDAHRRTIVAGGNEIRRFRINGDPDPQFGKNGRGFLALAEELEDTSLVVDSRERPLIAAAPDWLYSEGQPGAKVVVGRLTATGKADPSFGSKGSVAVGFGAKATVTRPQLVLDGKRGVVIVAPVKTEALNTGYGLAFARLSTSSNDLHRERSPASRVAGLGPGGRVAIEPVRDRSPASRRRTGQAHGVSCPSFGKNGRFIPGG